MRVFKKIIDKFNKNNGKSDKEVALDKNLIIEDDLDNIDREAAEALQFMMVIGM